MTTLPEGPGHGPAARPQGCCHIPAVVVPQGGGTYLIKAGRPVESLTVRAFADCVGLSSASVYRYIGSDSIPDRFVSYAGPRKILIAAGAVPHFLDFWRRSREG